MAPGNRVPTNSPVNPFSSEKSVGYVKQLRDKAKETALPHLKQSFYPIDVKNFYETKYSITTLAEYDSKAGFPEVYEFVKQSNKKGAKLVLKRLKLLHLHRELLSQSISPAKIRVQIRSRLQRGVSGRPALTGPALNAELEKVMSAYKEYRLIESFIRNRIFGAHENVSRMREKVSSQVEVSWVDKSREGIEKLFNTVGKKNRNLSTLQMWGLIGGAALIGYFGIKAAAGKFPKTAEFLKKWGGRGLWLAGGLGVGSLAYKWWTGRWPASDAQKWYNEKREVPAQWKNVFCKLNNKYCQSSSVIDTTINSAGRVLTYAGTKLSVEQARDKYLSARNTDKKVNVPGLVLKSELSQEAAFKGLNAINDIFAGQGTKGDGLSILAKNHPGMSLVAAFYAEITRRGAIKKLVEERTTAEPRAETVEHMIGSGVTLDYMVLNSVNAETNRRLQEGAATVFGMPTRPNKYMVALFKVANKYFKDMTGVSKDAAIRILTTPKSIGWNDPIALGTGKKRSEVCKAILQKFKSKHPSLFNETISFRKNVNMMIKETQLVDTNYFSYPGASNQKVRFVRSFRKMLGSTVELAYAGDKRAQEMLIDKLRYFKMSDFKNSYKDCKRIRSTVGRSGFIPTALANANAFNQFKTKLKTGVFAGFAQVKSRIKADLAKNPVVDLDMKKKLEEVLSSYKGLKALMSESYSRANATKLLTKSGKLNTSLNNYMARFDTNNITASSAKTKCGEYYANLARYFATTKGHRNLVKNGVLPTPKEIFRFTLNRFKGQFTYGSQQLTAEDIKAGTFGIHTLHCRVSGGRSMSAQLYDKGGKCGLVIKNPDGKLSVTLESGIDLASLALSAMMAMRVIAGFKQKGIKVNPNVDPPLDKKPFTVKNGKINFASGKPISLNPFNENFWSMVKVWNWGFDTEVKNAQRPPIGKVSFVRLLNALWYN